MIILVFEAAAVHFQQEMIYPNLSLQRFSQQLQGPGKCELVVATKVYYGSPFTVMQ